MSDIAIVVKNLTKTYHLYDKPVDRLKEALHPFKKVYHHDFHAMKDVSFEVKKGETVGVIGKNGAGKSTLLKMITGVLTPSSGSVEVHGTIASLLELGAGFNYEMTGRENIYLNGAIMGFSKEQMDAKVDAILAFADIGEFIEQPVKMYSSGMFARLAFSVAIAVEPDILIVDEALSVGDMLFQAKCMSKMKSLMDMGTTILFVSHDVNAVRSLCQRALFLEHGVLKHIGEAGEVVDIYVQEDQLAGNEDEIEILQDLNTFKTDEAGMLSYQKEDDFPIKTAYTPSVIEIEGMQRYGDKKAEILDYKILDKAFQESYHLTAKGRYYIQMSLKFYEDFPTFVVTTTLFSLKGEQLLSWINTQDDVAFPAVKKGDVIVVTIQIDLPVQAGVYKLGASVEFPTVPLRKHQYFDMIKGIKVIEVGFENPLMPFHSMFYTKGEYTLQKVKEGEAFHG